MNMKSGQSSQKKMETNALSQGPLSKGSSSSKGKDEDKSSSDLLGLASGEPRSIKQILAERIITTLESDGGEPLSSDKQQQIAQFIDLSSRGFASGMSMICSGKSCPFITACVINQVGAPLPVGKRCPLEQSIIVSWVTKHLEALGIEDINDPIHSFDLDLLYELAGQELVRWRCGVHLSDDPRLVSNQQVGATMQGEPIFADVINPVLEVMEKAGRNISKIREALVATREAQVKAGQINTDPTQKAADLKKKAAEIAKARKAFMEQTKDADFEVKDE